MKLQIVCVRDIVADAFGQPIFTHNIGGAIRQFGDQCQRQAPDNVMAQHPEDFELWHLGEYDDSDGSFYTEADGRQFEKKQIAVGANYRARKENVQ